jgi:hypothetical protein
MMPLLGVRNDAPEEAVPKITASEAKADDYLYRDARL